MLIRISKNNIYKNRSWNEHLFDGDYTQVIVPILDEVEDCVSWCCRWFPVYCDGVVGYLPIDKSRLRQFRQLLRVDDKVKIKGKGNTVYKVIGGGAVMYRAQDSNGVVLRRNYKDKNGELTFGFSYDEPERVEIVKSHGFDNFLSAVKTNSRYDNDNFNANIYKNYAAAIEAKTPIRNILSKHPAWNEEQQCIELNISFANKVNASEVTATADQLCEQIFLQSIFSAHSLDLFRRYHNLIRYSTNYFIDDSVAKIKPNEYELKELKSRDEMYHTHVFDDINFNAKVSKVTSAIMSKYKVQRTHEIEQAFAKYADAVSLKEKEYKFILSINPTDFVTMSHGNSWHSCHSFRDNGCYHAGSLSYALDKYTMIAYVIPKDTAGDYCMVNKNKRLLFMFSEDYKGLMSSKMYPDNNDTAARDAFDQTVLNILHDANHYIKPSAECVTIRELSIGLHYPDYHYGFRKVFGEPGAYNYVIGAHAYTFDTGYYMNTARICTSGEYDHKMPESITFMTDEISALLHEANEIRENISA